MTHAINPLKRLREFIASYSHFTNPEIIRPLSLWIAGTYLYEMFDSFPYLVITANVKRAGKTRLSELIGFTASMPFNVAGATAASLFRIIQDNKPTIMWDEAETLSSEASTITRAFLNVGYRKGQTIPRATGQGVIQWPTYCPKVFVLIGDVYDTLRDRSIIVEMERGEPAKRFSYETAKAEGDEIGAEIKSYIAANLERIQSAYDSAEVTFLTDRDAEIWRPIFALANVLDGETKLLSRIAVDMATEKTMPKRTYAMQGNSETQVEREEYARRALADMLTITAKLPFIKSETAVEMLRAIDIAPWRKYTYSFDVARNGGVIARPANDSCEPGLNMRVLATLLQTFDLKPKLIRNGQKVFRGYTRKDILAASKKYKVTA